MSVLENDVFEQYDPMVLQRNWQTCQDQWCTCFRCLKVVAFERMCDSIQYALLADEERTRDYYLAVAEKEAIDWQEYKGEYNKRWENA